MRCWVRVVAIGIAAWVLACIAEPAPCAARSRGIASEGCDGCHSTGAEPLVRLTAMGEAVPGQALRLLLEIETKNGPTAGFYLTTDIAGTLSSVAGQGTQVFGDGIAHTSPKSGSGFVRFELSWMAPADPTGVEFRVWAVSANDNRSSSGDGASFTNLLLASGCDGEMYFRDADGDGFGSSSFGMRLDCEQREGFTTIEGDCNENNADINPSATEYCNERDDDCDGPVDEGALPQLHYPDPDGDGHGQIGSEGVLDCPPPRGYAPTHDDCLEGEVSVFPGAEEVCDGRDNDCDGQYDERVKPICGFGWCARESWSCRPEDCTPGEPRAEECNAFDEDCDEVLDEDVDCGADLVCSQEGYCVDASTAGGSAGPDAAVNPGGAGGQGSTPTAGTSSSPPVMTPDPDAPTPRSMGGCSALRSRPAGRAEPTAPCAMALWILLACRHFLRPRAPRPTRKEPTIRSL
jgi:hypothetical protein